MDKNGYDDINAFVSLSVRQDLLLRQVSATLLEIDGILGVHRDAEKDLTSPVESKRNEKKRRKKWFFFGS